MKAPAFEYAAPSSVPEALEVLSAEPDAKVLAGGQSLVPLLNLRLARPSLIVDLARIDGLAAIEAVDGHVRLGAMVRQRDAELSPLVRERLPSLAEALTFVAHPQIRSRGTVGGSVAHADPSAEICAAVALLDGVVHVDGNGGRREIPASDFFLSHFTTALAPGEIVTALELPAQPDGACSAFAELTRRPGDFPLCGCGAELTLGVDGRIAGARIVLFGVGTTPVRATAAEAQLAGTEATAATFAAAAAAATAELQPPGDLQASGDYRRHLAEVVARRALEQAARRGGCP